MHLRRSHSCVRRYPTDRCTAVNDLLVYLGMKAERRPRETNQQLIRRFNRDVLQDGRLLEFKDRQFFVKKLSRNLRRKSAVKRAELAQQYRSY